MAGSHQWQHSCCSGGHDMPPDNDFFSADRIWQIKDILWWPFLLPLYDGLGQENRAAPPSWIQLSAVLVNVFKKLNLDALIQDPKTAEVIHSMGALFVDDTDFYT